MKYAFFSLITLCCAMTRADVFLASPSPPADSFLRDAMIRPAGKHTAEWDTKTRPNARNYSSMKAYQIAATQARFANIRALKQAVEQDCVATFGVTHQAACHCAVEKADFAKYAELEIHHIRNNKKVNESTLIFPTLEAAEAARNHFYPLWRSHKRIEQQCGLQKEPEKFFQGR